MSVLMFFGGLWLLVMIAFLWGWKRWGDRMAEFDGESK